MNKLNTLSKECQLAVQASDCSYCCTDCDKNDCPVRCEQDSSSCSYYNGKSCRLRLIVDNTK